MLGNRRTSVSLEDQVWDGLTEICRREEISIDELCTEVEQRRVGSSMSSGLRVFLMTYFRMLSEEFEFNESRGRGLAQPPQALYPSRFERVLTRFHQEQVVASSGTG